MIKKILKALGTVLLILLALAVLVPLLIPLPPPSDARQLEQVKDPDSQFITIDNLQMHYKQAGSGEPALVLLHGFGASTFSWRDVMAPLARSASVIAFDRPAFGLTARPMPGEWSGRSPYGLDAQIDLLLGLLDAKGIKQAVLVGNSAGGTLSLAFALKYPQRVRALVLVDAAVYGGGGIPETLKPFFATPWGRWYGTLISRTILSRGMDLLQIAWHDPARITPEIVAGYQKPLQLANWDRALWELSLAQVAPAFTGRLAELKMPVLVITGDDDRIVPTAQSLRLAQEIPGAQLAVIPACGHLPHEERPAEFLQVIQPFLSGLK